MRILVVSDTTGYMRGGVPAETRQLLDGMAARGHAVGFCGDIPLAKTGDTAFFPLTLPIKAEARHLLDRALLHFGPDIVHVMAMSSVGIQALVRVLDRGAWVMTCHSLSPHERKLARWHANEALHYSARYLRYLAHTLAWRWLLGRGRIPHVVTHSQWVSDLVSGYGQVASNITLIPLGCELEPTSGRAGRGVEVSPSPRIVTTGGIAHTKGYHDAIRAMAVVASSFPDLDYQIIGEVRDQSYLAYLRSLIDRLGLQDRVRITPNLPQADKQRALESADLYLQPSHEEGFCLSYIEAAPHVPRLVGADTGAIRLISENDAGARVVPTGQPARMAAAILALLGEALPADLMLTRLDRLALRFSWSAYLDAHERLYASLIECGRKT